MGYLLTCIYFVFVYAANMVSGIIPYGPTEVQKLTPCNSVIRLAPNLQSTTIFQLDALESSPQPAAEEYSGTSCAFIFEGPQNATLTFQFFGVSIKREEKFPNNTAPCLATPVKSSVQLYDYTSEGNLELISIVCQNETWSEKTATSSNIGVITSTISGHFAVSIQKVYAAQLPQPPQPIKTLPYYQYV